MILSIAMIVRDEEKYLEKTLSALKPLMSKIESELIIVDTGSVDKTVEIARKYTDKVYFKSWTGNFAEMRNESIKYATGEWILILDADEELIEFDKFIDFINSEKSKTYKTGVVKLRNFVNEDLRDIIESPMPRLFKNEKDFKYECRIHEQPLFKKPVYNPLGGIMVFNHYGYIYEDESIRQKKMKRNEELLIEELKENPNDPYMNYQLGQNYVILNKLNKAMYYLEKSVKLYSKRGAVYIPASVKLMNCYSYLNENLKCEKECFNYLKRDKKNIDVYYYLAISQLAMFKYTESISNFKKYFYYIDNYDESTQAVEISCTSETLKYINKAVRGYCQALYELNKYNEVLDFVEKNKNKISDIAELYSIIIDSLFCLDRGKDILVLYNKYVNSESEKRLFFTKIEQLINAGKVENLQQVYSVLSKIDGSYGILNKSRLDENFDVNKLIEILNEENDAFYGELILYILKKDVNFLMLSKKISSIKIKLYFDYIFRINKPFIPIIYDIIFEYPISYDIQDLIFKTTVMESLIFSGGLSRERKYLLYKYYISEKYRLIKLQYDTIYTDENLLNITRDINEYLVINIKLLNEYKQKDSIRYLKEIKNLIIKYPLYKDILNSMVEEFMKEKEFELTEMSNLKKQYLLFIEKNIQENNLEISKKLIDEYIEINGKDEKILNLESICEIMMGDYQKAIECLEAGYKINGFNYDIIYNLAFANTLKNDLQTACFIYELILREVSDEDMKLDVKNKLLEIKKTIL